MATFPGGVKAWTAVVDNVDYILDHHINDVYAEIIAIETQLLSNVAWTPTLTGITVGNGTVVARWQKTGKEIHFQITITLGSTSLITGEIYFVLPVWALQQTVLIGGLYDANTYTRYLAMCMLENNLCYVRVTNASATYVTQTNLSATIPFTWATGDAIHISGTYESA